MGISFDNAEHIDSGDDLESRLSRISGDLERAYDRLGACIPVDVRSVEDVTRCIRDTEHFLNLLNRARLVISALKR